ncbi:MAG: DUF3137 domain-containing protein [Elainellaceae cyanobacterium]
MSTQLEALHAGIAALEAGHYDDAIHTLEQFCQSYSDSGSESTYLLQAQMSLVKAHHLTGQTQRAIALAKQLTHSSNPTVKTWASKLLSTLTSPESIVSESSSSSSDDLSQYLTRRTPAAVTHSQPSESPTQDSAELLTEEPVESPAESPNQEPAESPLESLSNLDTLYHRAHQAFENHQYPVAIAAFEAYVQRANRSELKTAQAQMYLVKAYQEADKPDQALALCRQLTASSHEPVKAWATQTMTLLSASGAIIQSTDRFNNQSNALSDSLLMTPNRSTVDRSTAGRSTAERSPQGHTKPSSPDSTEALRLKTLTTFRKHYDKELYQSLEVFESQRQKIVLTLIAISLVMAAMVGLLSLTLSGLLPHLIAGGAVIYIFIYRGVIKNYRREFKHKIIRQIVRFIDPSGNLTYSLHPVGQSNRGAFINSWLFQKSAPDRFKEEDCIEGSWGDTTIFFSEIHAEKQTRDSDGNREYRTIFKGLFFQANFNKSFNGRTIVIPDVAERWFGGLGKAFQSINQTRGELIQLEDPEFERLFAVYGNDQIEARYILSTSLMRRLVELRKKVNRDLYVAFVANQIYIAIRSHKDLFEPRIFRSVLDFAPAQEYFETLQMMIGIVEDLNLNLRIWK